jgi:DNA (cytosine-5)-methyltransferase 1
MQLVLSTFSGAGLLDKAFKNNGFCVVSAGDIILNHDIRDFAAPSNKFDGVIGGSPCQDFSKANRDRPVLEKSYGFEMLQNFKRVVLESQPQWALLENVPSVPDLYIEGYSYQRIDINQSWYEDTNRLRHIQFFSKNDLYLHFERGVTDRDNKIVTDRSQKCDSAALASDDRPFKELLRLQGLPLDINFPDFTVKGKKKLIGNGVPISIGNVLAQAVLDVTVPGNKNICDSVAVKRCKCDCKRIVTHRGDFYDYSCRKRYQRKNNANSNK